DKTFNRLPRNEKGEFDLGDLFALTDNVPAEVGARYNATAFKINSGSASDGKSILIALVIILAALGLTVVIEKKM
ncbi:MAG: hypothetical protein IJM48_05700, partial [Treponema sp.]|nr:hypothetical protein [Treponema sp.]